MPIVRQYEKHKYDSVIIREIHKGGVKGHAHITPTKIDIDEPKFDDAHINGERGHNVTKEQAHGIIKSTAVSVTVLGGKIRAVL